MMQHESEEETLYQPSRSVVVLESDSCTSTCQADASEVEAESSRIKQESMIKELERRLGWMTAELRSVNKKKEKCAWELDQIQTANKEYIEENALLAAQLYQMEKKVQEMHKSVEAPATNNIIVRRNPASNYYRADVVSSDNEEEAQHEDLDDFPNILGLKDQISELKGLFSVQEGTLQKFQEALDENKKKNQQLVSLISEIKDEKSTQMQMITNPMSYRPSLVSNPPEFSEFMSSLISFEDIESSTEKEVANKNHRFNMREFAREKAGAKQQLFTSFILAIKL